MIYREQHLKGSDSTLISAMQTFHYGLGHPFDIQIIVAKGNQDYFEVYEQQGGDVAPLNEARKALGLYPLTFADNFKIVKKNWGKLIAAGKGCVFTIEKTSYKYKKNKDIETAIEWLQEKVSDIKIEVLSNKKHDTFFMSLKVKETKEDVPKEAINEEAI